MCRMAPRSLGSRPHVIHLARRRCLDGHPASPPGVPGLDADLSVLPDRRTDVGPPRIKSLSEPETVNTNKLVGRVTISANAIGLAAGPLWSGLVLEYAPWPGRLVWLLQTLVTLAIMPFMRVPGGMRVRQAPIGRTLRSITRGWSASAALVAGFCTFSSGGLLASLGSVVLESSLGVHSSALAGLLVSRCFVLSAVIGAVRLRGAIFPSPASACGGPPRGHFC